VVDEDWEGHDPDAFWTDTGTEIPFLDSAEHHFVSATLTRDPDAPLGRVFGDLLVLHSSAWAHRRTGERLRFPLDHYRHGAASVTSCCSTTLPSTRCWSTGWASGRFPRPPKARLRRFRRGR